MSPAKQATAARIEAQLRGNWALAAEAWWEDRTCPDTPRPRGTLTSDQRCDVCEVAWFNVSEGRPMLLSDWHDVVVPHLSAASAERRWERLKRRLFRSLIPHRCEAVRTHLGGRAVGLTITCSRHEIDHYADAEVAA